MATIVNNVPTRDVDTDRGSSGWVVAVIILLLVLLIGYFGFARFGGHSSTANVNVSLPSGGGSAGGSGGAGGGSTGGAAQ